MSTTSTVEPPGALIPINRGTGGVLQAGIAPPVPRVHQAVAKQDPGPDGTDPSRSQDGPDAEGACRSADPICPPHEVADDEPPGLDEGFDIPTPDRSH